MICEPLVSVITPAYNEEAYVAECIESVLNQSYRNFEYIIVDNFSSDDTASIVEKYRQKDGRIRSFRNSQTVPVNENHNIGFRNICQDSVYCKIVDADDWLYPDCLQKMVKLASTDEHIGFVGVYRFVGDKLDPGSVPFPITRVPGSDVCRGYMLKNGYPFGAPSSFLYRSDLVRSRQDFYEKSVPAADLNVFLEFLDQYDMGFVHEILAFSRARIGSEMDWRVKFDTLYLDFLDMLARYGKKYLSERELSSATNSHLNDYYRRLGMRFWNREDPKFWEYHERKLRELGYNLSKPRVWLNAAGYAVEAGVRRLVSR